MMDPGTIIFSLSLQLRAVPWKASQVTKHGTYKPKSLREWQATVAQYARLNWGNREPYGGPVETWCRFEFSNGPMGDADNLGKACVDALQGIVIINDRQVVRNTAERVRVNESNFTFIEVRTA